MYGFKHLVFSIYGHLLFNRLPKFLLGYQWLQRLDFMRDAQILGCLYLLQLKYLGQQVCAVQLSTYLIGIFRFVDLVCILLVKVNAHAVVDLANLLGSSLRASAVISLLGETRHLRLHVADADVLFSTLKLQLHVLCP